MTKKLTILLLFTIYSSITFGQILPVKQVPYPQIVIVKIKQPLVIIGSLETKYSSLLIDTKNLKIIKTYKDPSQLATFGEKGKDGVILAELKNKTALLRLEETLDYYKVPAQNRTLKVLVNNALIDPELFLADIKRIDRIEKIKQDIADPLRYSFNKDEEYLNIVTKKD